jgi:acyl dehydratase
MRWCAAQQNWDRIHYDLDYARDHANLPGTIINGALKQHLLAFYLLERLGPGSWIRSLTYRFTGIDLVGDTLELFGTVVGVKREGPYKIVSVELGISNTRTGQPTTVGSADVLLSTDGEPVLDDLGCNTFVAIPEPDDGNDAIAERILGLVGEVIEEVTSYVPVEKGRLALFADAVMNVPDLFYDDEAAAEGPYGAVVAPPLYPIHSLTARPDTRPLNNSTQSMGREGVCEIGRDFATIFDFKPTGLLNGGNQVWVHSLARAGETVRGRSRLLSARRRHGRKGGDMLILETNNTYETVDGRPLLTEQLTIIYRME